MAATAFIFPGQGAQSVGMGRDIADASPAAAEVFRRADDVLGFKLSEICFQGPESELTRTDVQQPAIFATSVAIWEALRDRGAAMESVASATAGLSLGEYTALYAAGSLTFEDGLRLVRRRGELMQEAATAVRSGMVSIIGGDEKSVEALCADAAEGEVLVPANFNCPGQIVISGAMGACERAVERASAHGVKGVMLKVAGAFHSPLMAPAAEKLADVLAEVRVSQPRVPVIANVDAAPHAAPDAIRATLCRQVTQAVRWQQSIERLIRDGFDRFVEIGPGRVLTGLMRKIDRKASAVNISTANDLGVEVLTPTA